MGSRSPRTHLRTPKFAVTLATLWGYERPREIQELKHLRDDPSGLSIIWKPSTPRSCPLPTVLSRSDARVTEDSADLLVEDAAGRFGAYKLIEDWSRDIEVLIDPAPEELNLQRVGLIVIAC